MTCQKECTCQNCNPQKPTREVPLDKATIDRIALLHPKLRVSARAIYDEARALGIRMRITSTLRTFAEQQVIYNQGRTTKGLIVTNAKPGTSWHNYGMAFDFSLLTEDGKALIWDLKYDSPDDGAEADWMQVVEIAKKHSWTWGGDWKFRDNPHFQYVFGLTITQALEKYNSGKVEDGYILA